MKNIILSVLCLFAAFGASAQCSVAPITGLATVMVGDTIRQLNTTPSGLWTSSDTTIAIIDTTGKVTGRSRGLVLITYRLTGTCSSTFTTDSIYVTSGIIGHIKTCLRDTTRLRDTLATGTWSSSDTSKVVINSATGLIYGRDTGYTIISYAFSRFGQAFTAKDTFRVKTVPRLGGISDSAGVCVGSNISLSDTVASVIWTSSDSSIASFYAASSHYARVSANRAGACRIICTSDFCTLASDTIFTEVYPTANPGTISPGYSSLCVGMAISMASSGDTGGIWSSSNSTVAAVTSTGVVIGVGFGTAYILYSVSNAHHCNDTAMSYVYLYYPAADPVTGPDTFRVGTSAAYHGSGYGSYHSWDISPNIAALSDLGDTAIFTGITIGSGTINSTYSTLCYADRSSKVIYIAPPSIGYVSTYLTGYVNGDCASAEFGVSIPAHTATYTLVTYFGDGDTDTRSIAADTTAALTSYHHSYAQSGVYSIKQKMFTGSTVVDSTLFSYAHRACYNIHASFYYDANGNCRYDSSESLMAGPSRLVIDSNGVTIDTIPITSGFNYQAWGTPGDVYRFHLIPSAASISCPSTGIFYDTLSSVATGEVPLMIGLSCPGSGFDLVSHTTRPTGRHRQEFHINVGNNYCTPVNGRVTLYHSPRYNFADATPTPTSYTATSVTWDLSSLSTITGAHPSLYVHAEVPGTWLTPGDTVQSRIVLTPASGSGAEIDTNNNQQWWVDTVKSSFDPNFITVVPEGKILNGSKLTYTVQFENDGNDTARNIHVMDTLADELDINSLEMIMATAAMNTEIFRAGGHNIVKFDFPNIRLADSSHHGHCTGTFMYSINALRGLVTGTLIPARVGIYFDDNPVVMTGTVNSEIVIPGDTIASVPGTSICAGDTVWFTSRYNSVHNTHFQWFVNSTAMGRDTSAFQATRLVNGDRVSATMTSIMDDTIHTATNTLTMTVNPLPFAASISGDSTLCVAASTTLTDTAHGGRWIMTNSNATIGSSTGVVTARRYGTDSAIYIVSNSCGSDSAAYVIIIDTIPDAGVITGPTLICDTNSITLVTTGAAGHWLIANTHAAMSAGTVSGRTPGTDTAMYVLTNYCASDTARYILQVQPNVVTAVAISVTADSLCAGIPVTFTTTPTHGGSAPIFRWRRFGTIIDSGVSFTYTPTLADRITCEMTSSEDCPNPSRITSNEITMLVIPSVTPTVGIIAIPADSVAYPGQMVNFYASPTYGGSGITYQWYVNNSPVTGATSNAFNTNVFHNDTVWCAITSNAPCATDSVATSNAIVIQADYLGLNNINNQNADIKIIPNPNHGEFIVACEGLQNGAYELDVMDALGIRRYHSTANCHTGSLSAKLLLNEQLTAGNYWLVIRGNGGQVVRVFLVQ